MADSEVLIPFIIAHEAGIAPEHAAGRPVGELLSMARPRGFADDPADRGGATFCGVTLATYRGYCSKRGLPTPDAQALRQMPASEWHDIFRSLYWDRWHADDISSQRVANILVDFVWASGVHGVKVPQRVLGVEADGVAGMRTLRALEAAIAADGRLLATRLTAARLEFVEGIVRRDPSQKRFIRGWRRRINALMEYCAW